MIVEAELSLCSPFSKFILQNSACAPKLKGVVYLRGFKKSNFFFFAYFESRHYKEHAL